jgi:hypothetical protein
LHAEGIIMKGLKRANFTLGWITGALFFCFGIFFLLTAMVKFPDLGVIPGGILAIVALARLVLTSLPASGTGFSGSGALEIASGILETLFGVFFILNALIYIEFFYPLVAGLLAVLAVVRIRQGALVKKQGAAGMSAYVFIGVLLLVAAAGMVLDMVWLGAGLMTELIGTAAFLYGVFLFSASFFKREKPVTGPEEDGMETRAERNSA